MATDKSSPRQRTHQKTRERIHAFAMRQLAERGPAGLSMSAIAREMGVTQPALFRYVANRDALITELVIAAYEDFINHLTLPGTLSAVEMLRTQGRAMRMWALDNPHQYQLIFGTPIPGYVAPREELADVDQRLMNVLVGPYVGLDVRSPQSPYEQSFGQWATSQGITELSGWAIRHALVGWTRLHGILSLELAGHFTDRLPYASLVYDAELDNLVREFEAAIAM